MNATYQQLLHKWATLAPDQCLTTNRDYNFKVKILPTVEKRNSSEAWRLISSENIAWRLDSGEGLVFSQLNFLLLTVMHYCAVRHSSIQFAFDELGVSATICHGLKSQAHPHPAIAALDAYIQLLEF
ncbi:hypothetical protein [Nostoc sp. TCL26-01]|uniref:hypothetical protein n=1 Tax=Nostoc sp. TCL26-01 TaxID=2576904 RepID=UPI0015BD1D16|nr:hypothetical protein [Nostoc sp. TCL26-01]QLE59620.1 hypothetical protein FD725_29630 [Nostoc sp. TCL26-01]